MHRSPIHLCQPAEFSLKKSIIMEPLFGGHSDVVVLTMVQSRPAERIATSVTLYDKFIQFLFQSTVKREM